MSGWGRVLTGILCGCALAAQAAQGAHNAIPDLTAADYGWYKDYDGFVALPGRPGPITQDKAYPFVPNNEDGKQTTYRIADITNPILKPWAAAQMKKANDEALAGEMPFRARTSCWPAGVPNFLLFGRMMPLRFIQTPKITYLVNQPDAQVRRVYMNVPHSKNLKPSWYGESVGHWDGNTLVVDTIGQNDKSFVDDYRTPHTARIHVVEYFKVIDSDTIETTFSIDDPGAYTTPWWGKQIFRRVNLGILTEDPCEASADSFFADHLHPMPQAGRFDF